MPQHTHPIQPPRPLLQPAPKLTGSLSGKAQAKELTLEQKAAKFDAIVRLRKAKRKAQQTISILYRDIERMEAEEAQVLDDDLSFGFSKPQDERCGQCGFLSCICEVVE